MNANDKNKALNEDKLKNISEVIKNSLQFESDLSLKKEHEVNKNQNIAPILEIEKIEPEKQEIDLKSEEDKDLLLPEELEEANMIKSEEEIAKIQEQLLLIGASDEISEQELGTNVQKKSLNPTTIEFKISRTADGQTIFNPIEKENINNDKDEIFDQKEENKVLDKNTRNYTQNQFEKNDNLITKEYLEEVRESLNKAINAIKNLEKSRDLENLEVKNLPKDQKTPGSKAKNSTENNLNNTNTKNIETIKNKLLEELKKSELIFEDTKDPLGERTIKQTIDAAKKWQNKENSSQINWDLGSKFHPNQKLYNKLVAQEYKVLAEKFTEVKNEYKNTKEQLEVESKLTTNNISKIIAATKEFANQVINLILLVENSNQ
nr:hypothetical protein [Borrelia sp. CA_690]